MKEIQSSQNKPVFIDDNIASQFASMSNKTELAEVMKELFDKGKIYLIGDLTKDEIKLATRIYMIAKMKKLSKWIDALNFFCTLLISKDRKSREEILKAIAGYSQQQNIWSRINPMNWGRQR